MSDTGFSIECVDTHSDAGEGVPSPLAPQRLYTAAFFRVFACVMLMMTAVALQFHFGQYVQFLGHDVTVLGYVLGLSPLGSLAIRLHIGRWIDRFGTQPVWVAGAAVFAAASVATPFTDALWLIAVLKIISSIGIAGALTTVPVFAIRIAPPNRSTEAVGTMGLAGFTGFVLGPALGDWIFGGDTNSITPYYVFFFASAACAVSAAVLMVLLHLGRRPGPAVELPEPPGTWGDSVRVIRGHWPGMILLVSVVFASVMCVHMSFLERLAEARHFKDIRLFFFFYAPTAMALRVLGRDVPRRIGRARTVVCALIVLGAGILLLRGVESQWGLVPAAVVMGVGHSFVIPSMTDLAVTSLPAANRGLATSLFVGSADVGYLLGFLLLGECIGGVGFDTTFTGLSCAVFATSLLFCWCARDRVFGLARGNVSA